MVRPDSTGGAPSQSNEGRGELALYRVAFDEALRTLDDQRDELNGMRDRVVSYVAFVAAAIAFLVGTSVGAHNRDTVFYALAIAASAFSLIAVAGCAALLWPRKWQFRARPTVLIEQWIEAQVPGPANEVGFYRNLAVRYDASRLANERTLSWMRCFYVGTIVFGFAGVLGWAALVWLRA